MLFTSIPEAKQTMRDELGVSYFPCSIQQKYNVCSLSYRKYNFAKKVNKTRALKLRFHEKIQAIKVV